MLGGEKDLDGLKRLWIEAYRVKYGELQRDRKRLEAMSSEPADPGDFADMLSVALIERIGKTAVIVYRGKAIMAIEEEDGVCKPVEVDEKHRRIIEGRMASREAVKMEPGSVAVEGIGTEVYGTSFYGSPRQARLARCRGSGEQGNR